MDFDGGETGGTGKPGARDRFDVVDKFMEASTFRKMHQPDQRKGLPQPPLADEIPAGARVLNLPDHAPATSAGLSLSEALRRRRSVRDFSPAPVSLVELSYLLWATQGVQRVTDRPATLRPVPSAGSRHPFETYLLCNRVEGLAPGLYKYAALDHKLVEVDTAGGVLARFTEAICDQPLTILTENAVTFIWVAVAYRSVYRYSERAYRFMHLDAGHVCQNLYLAALQVGAGCCAIGGYHDGVINRLLGLDGEERFVIYAAAVGASA